jgi:outer membrane protein assembly factor BamB
MTRTTLRGWVCLAALAAAGVAAGLAAAAPSHDWPQFRGANRDGVSAETGLLASWPAGGPRQAWRVKIGPGYSGIAVVGQRLYTMYAADHEGKALEFAAAFDAATGRELWRTAVGDKHVGDFGDGPRSTPTVAGDTVYVLGARGDLAALAAADGAVRWRVQLTEAFGSKVPYFGFSTSVLVDGEQVVVEGGGKEGKSFAGLDRKTGATRWTSGNGPDEPSYNSAISFSVGGKTRYAYIVGASLKCIDAGGSEVWSHPWTYPGETHATPIFIAPDRIFASGAEGVGATLLRFVEQEGTARVEEVWKSANMRNHFSASVVRDGHVYGFDNASLRCLSLDKGESAWVRRGLGKGSLVLADGHLVVLSDQGLLVLVEATPEGYKEKGSVQALQGRCWTSPSLAHGRVYLRNYEEMVCYDLKG